MSKDKREAIDFMSNRLVKAMLKSTYFPSFFQFAGLLIFLALAFFGFNGTTEAFRFTNLTSFWVWCLWWPALVFIALISSRLWCSVCPLRLISQTVDKFGLNVKIPKYIRKNRILIIIGFFLLHTVIVSFGVHHYSWSTSLYLLGLLGFALFVGLLFERNAFCNSFCPLNGFIGAYSKLGTIELQPIDKDICRTCKTKDCYHSCPSRLCMGAMEDTENCILCFDCVKKCPGDNIRLSPRSPIKALWKVVGSTSGLIITAILMGIMMDEFGEEWAAVHNMVTAVPHYLTMSGVPDVIWGYKWLDSVWVVLVLPLLVIFSASGLACLFSFKGRLLEFAKVYSPSFLPLIFSMHLCKMIHTVNGKFGYAKYALTDPLGGKTATAIHVGALHVPGDYFFSTQTEGFILLVLVFLGMIGSLFAAVHQRDQFVEKQVRIGSLSAFVLMHLLLGETALLIILNWFGLF